MWYSKYRLIRLFRTASHLRPCRPSSCLYSTSRQEPLQILFCGADDFSIFSLEAFHKLRQVDPALIASIHVLCKNDKATGRGSKTISSPPIKAKALSLDLPTHQIDTFTGWTPPFSYNLIIAVSFGLLIPPRILSGANYGGLNVHPSLLPDLRGPAPIHRALLHNDTHTGVTLQTLHPQHFDRGDIVAQTPAIAIPKTATVETLLPTLGHAGADLLTQSLKTQSFLPPYSSKSSSHSTHGLLRHAPRITSSDHKIDPEHDTANKILTYSRVLGRLSCPASLTIFLQNITPFKAASPIQITGLTDVTDELPSTQSAVKTTYSIRRHNNDWKLLLRTVDGRFLTPESINVPGRTTKTTSALLEALIANAPRGVREGLEG